MKYIYSLLLLLPVLAHGQTIHVFKEGEYYGLSVNASWGTYYIPATFQYADKKGNAYWNDIISTKFTFKDDRVISKEYIGNMIPESHADIILLASIGQLPSHWTVHDLEMNIFDNSKLSFVVINRAKDYKILVSYEIRMQDGRLCRAHIHTDENRIVIYEYF